MNKQDFHTMVRDLVDAKFEVSEEFPCKEDYFSWIMSCVVAEQYADLNRREWANVILHGIPPMTYSRAIAVVEDVYVNYVGSEHDQEVIDTFINTINEHLGE